MSTFISYPFHHPRILFCDASWLLIICPLNRRRYWSQEYKSNFPKSHCLHVEGGGLEPRSFRCQILCSFPNTTFLLFYVSTTDPLLLCQYDPLGAFFLTLRLPSTHPNSLHIKVYSELQMFLITHPLTHQHCLSCVQFPQNLTG